MGNACARVKYGSGALAPNENNDEGGAPRDSGSETHALVVCLNYPDDPDNRLSATDDGDNFIELLRASGVTDITTLYNGQGTVAKVEAAVREVGARCQEGDYFVFFYGGHGDQLDDQDNDEDDGFDECFVLVDEKGEINDNAYYRDDDFANLVSSSVDEGVNVLVLTDCCHSATICDFEKPCWNGIKGVNIAGCKDHQESGDTGSGGIFTHSMLLAVSDFSSNPKAKKSEYSLAQLYNRALQNHSNRTIRHDQDISMCSTSTCGCPSNMAWPLLPLAPYQAPNHKKNPIRSLGVKVATKSGHL